VDYRTYLNLYMLSQVYGWTGSAYWSLAGIDALAWILATLCTWQLGSSLGISRRGSVAAAALLATSPIFFTQMWHQDLHLANSASLPPGLWGVAALIQRPRRARLIAGLAFVFLILSMTYQYQWFVAPVAMVLLAFDRSLGARKAVWILAASLGLFLVVTAALGIFITFSGLAASGDRLGAVQQPLALRSQRVGQEADPTALLQERPRLLHVLLTSQAYHPVVYVLGMAGLLLLGTRGAALASLAFALPLLFMLLYPTPWVMMTAYPLIYLGAGRACELLGRVRGRLGVALVAVAVVGLAALTNRDVWGDVSFLLDWWNLYSAKPIH
jgi:hypothetical protein